MKSKLLVIIAGLLAAWPSQQPVGAKELKELKVLYVGSERTGEFVVNLATFDLREAMNASSASLPAGANEFLAAGLETLPSRLVKPPRRAQELAKPARRVRRRRARLSTLRSTAWMRTGIWSAA